MGPLYSCHQANHPFLSAVTLHDSKFYSKLGHFTKYLKEFKVRHVCFFFLISQGKTSDVTTHETFNCQKYIHKCDILLLKRSVGYLRLHLQCTLMKKSILCHKLPEIKVLFYFWGRVY